MKRFFRGRLGLVTVAGVIIAAVAVSPAIGGPSLKSLVKKEVKKQLKNKVGPQGPPGSNANLGTITTVNSGNIAVANNDSNNGQVSCAAGQVAISGGANIQGLPVGASLNASRRVDSDTWTASVTNQSGGSVNLQIQVDCITP